MKVASLLSNFSSSSEWTSINRAKDFKTDPKLSEKTKFATKWSITLLSFARKTQNLWFCDFPAPYLKIKTKDNQLFLAWQPLSTLLSSQLTFKRLTQQSELVIRVKKISLFYFFLNFRNKIWSGTGWVGRSKMTKKRGTSLMDVKDFSLT